MNLKLWVDDTRRPPDWEEINCPYLWCKSVNQAIAAIGFYERNFQDDEILIDLDYDAGDYADQGGDYIKILDFLEEQGIVDTGYFFHLHSQNVVGVENMRRIIEHNNWREIR